MLVEELPELPGEESERPDYDTHILTFGVNQHSDRRYTAVIVAYTRI